VIPFCGCADAVLRPHLGSSEARERVSQEIEAGVAAAKAEASAGCLQDSSCWQLNGHSAEDNSDQGSGLFEGLYAEENEMVVQQQQQQQQEQLSPIHKGHQQQVDRPGGSCHGCDGFWQQEQQLGRENIDSSTWHRPWGCCAREEMCSRQSLAAAAAAAQSGDLDWKGAVRVR